MFKFENPFDISKDGQNPLIDGVRFHIRQSDEYKQQIKDYIIKYIEPDKGDKPLDILEYTMNSMNISDSELTITDEHELLDWIYEYFY